MNNIIKEIGTEFKQTSSALIGSGNLVNATER